MYSKYDVRLIIRKLERLFLVEFLTVIAIVGLIIYSFYVFYNGKKEDAQEKSNFDNSKEVAQAHGYILEEIGTTLNGRPCIELQKEISSEKRIILRLMVGSIQTQSFGDNQFNKRVSTVTRIEYPLSGYDLKRIEEKVVDGSHFFERDEDGVKIPSK